MKIRFSRIGNLKSIGRKGAVWSTLLFILAFAISANVFAEEKTNSARIAQPQSNTAPLPKGSTTGNAAKEASGAKPSEISSGAITDLTIVPADDKVTVTVATDRLITPQEFLMDKPARLVLDFPNTRNKVGISQFPVNAASIKKVRIQQFQTTPSLIARVVLDLEEDFGAHEVITGKDSVRLVFHKAKAKSSASAPIKAADLTKGKPLGTPDSAANNSFIPTAAAATVREARPIESAPKAAVPAAAPTRPAEAIQSRPLPVRIETPKASPVKETKTAAAPPATPVVRPIPVLIEQKPAANRVELPHAAVVETPKVAPLVASLTPVSMARPSAMPQGNSRFSGQPLTLDLIDIPLVDFFRLMSEEGGINIVMDPEIRGRVSIKVVKVPWDQIFEAVLINNGLDKQVDGTVVRIARKETLQNEAKQVESLKKANLLAADLDTRIRHLNYAKAATLIKALEDQKTVRGTIVVEERTNSLILTDLPSSIAHMINLIDALDVPQPQVEIEARIVSATRDFARDIGIQFGFVQGNLQRVTVGGPNTFGTIGGTRPSATPNSTYAAGNSSSGRGASDSTVSESASVSTGASSNNKGNYNVNLPSNLPYGGLGLSIGNIFDTFLLDAAITAGESKGLAKLISQPKVTAQNNNPAVVTQGLRFPVQVVANNTIAVQFQNASLTLTVTPQITSEGNIVLDLKIENNTPDFGKQVNGIPSIRTSESTTRVLVSDGGTTVIGGILLDDESTTQQKVPGLGDLPLLGHLFRRDAVSRSTQEVLFFVTPRVLK